MQANSTNTPNSDQNSTVLYTQFLKDGLFSEECQAIEVSQKALQQPNPCAAGWPEDDQEHELAVMFLDIRGFTSWMEARPVREVITGVRRLFSVFNQIIKSYNGKTITMAGDSLYAVFGLGTGIREAAAQAYQAGHKLFETMDLFNRIYGVPYYGQPLEVGVGLNTGKVMIGQFGLDAHQQLSVMGLPVNIASRLQGETKNLNNNFIVAEETYALLADEVSAHEKRSVRLKGLTRVQDVRLAGKPYQHVLEAASQINELAYLMAIAG
ncbi:adenylate/guanylate cyclase domain-containing protein [Mucilaginibacter sp. CSA2-8R]|uniref:adenylate/guanylate cyclase domain-containing protein n=1 Tax=Mucilaginibacter sp. CSA2-8R TaxID=3141542 RepID=UPI00315CE691